MTAASYEFQFCGECLGGIVPSGMNIAVDPTLEIRPLDVVAVLLDAEAGGAFAAFINSIGADGFLGVCKIYLGSHISRQGERVHLVGQLNPPVISPIPASSIAAMHRCTGIPANGGQSVTAEDAVALELLVPFVTSAAPTSPINSAWQPAQEAA